MGIFFSVLNQKRISSKKVPSHYLSKNIAREFQVKASYKKGEKKHPCFQGQISSLIECGRCHMCVTTANTCHKEPSFDSEFLRRQHPQGHNRGVTPMCKEMEVRDQTYHFRCLFPQTAQTAGLLQCGSSETTTEKTSSIIRTKLAQIKTLKGISFKDSIIIHDEIDILNQMIF